MAGKKQNVLFYDGLHYRIRGIKIRKWRSTRSPVDFKDTFRWSQNQMAVIVTPKYADFLYIENLKLEVMGV